MNPVFLTGGTSLFRISHAIRFGAIPPHFNRRWIIARVQRKLIGKTVGAAGRSSGRNGRIVVFSKRDGTRHGSAVYKTVAARALGWRCEVSAVNRTHGPARCEYGDK